MMMPNLQIAAQSAPRGCPFCLTGEIDVLANFHDTLAAYRCPRCAGVFYTIASPTGSRGPQVTHLLQRSPRRYQRGRPLRARRPPLPFQSLARWLPAATSPKPRPRQTLPLPGQPLNQSEPRRQGAWLGL
jgi:hypothetical protein